MTKAKVYCFKAYSTSNETFYFKTKFLNYALNSSPDASLCWVCNAVMTKLFDLWPWHSVWRKNKVLAVLTVTKPPIYFYMEGLYNWTSISRWQLQLFTVFNCTGKTVGPIKLLIPHEERIRMIYFFPMTLHWLDVLR